LNLLGDAIVVSAFSLHLAKEMQRRQRTTLIFLWDFLWKPVNDVKLETGRSVPRKSHWEAWRHLWKSVDFSNGPANHIFRTSRRPPEKSPTDLPLLLLRVCAPSQGIFSYHVCIECPYCVLAFPACVWKWRDEVKQTAP
jgi:hypothetical protein